MVKKVKTIIKLQIPAGEATAAPPVGPALGQHGLPIMDFVKAFNEKSAKQKGDILPVVITVFENRTFSFIIKKPPVSEMIKKILGIKKGSSKPGRETVGTLTKAQAEEIAKKKMSDLNTKDLEAAKRTVVGTAKSMGIKVELR